MASVTILSLPKKTVEVKLYCIKAKNTGLLELPRNRGQKWGKSGGMVIGFSDRCCVHAMIVGDEGTLMAFRIYYSEPSCNNILHTVLLKAEETHKPGSSFVFV